MMSIQRAHTTVILPAIRGTSSLIVPRSGNSSTSAVVDGDVVDGGSVVVVVFVVLVVFVLIRIVSNTRVVISCLVLLVLFIILVESSPAGEESGRIRIVVDDATVGSQ